MAEIKIAGTLHNTEAIQGDDLHSHVVANANEILDAQKEKKQSDINADVDAALDDRYTKEETYNKSELNNMITTPDVEYITVTTYQELLAITDHPEGALYRVANWDGTQVVTNKYAEYSYNGTGYVLLAVRDHGIANASDFENPTEAQRDLLPTVGAYLDAMDATPTPDSVKPVQSGGVFDSFLKSNKKMSFEINPSTLNYQLRADETFGADTNYRHAALSVNEGEVYILENYGNDDTVRYAFATSDAFSSGGAVPVVSGTEVESIPANTTVYVTIPAGCSYLLYNAGSKFSSRAYKVGSKLDFDDMPTEDSQYAAKSGGVYSATRDVPMSVKRPALTIAEATTTATQNSLTINSSGVITSDGTTSSYRVTYTGLLKKHTVIRVVCVTTASRAFKVGFYDQDPSEMQSIEGLQLTDFSSYQVDGTMDIQIVVPYDGYFFFSLYNVNWTSRTWSIYLPDDYVTDIDISAINGGASYASLSDALAAVPASLQRGGVTVRFVKGGQYVYYKLYSTAWSTSSSNWKSIENNIDALSGVVYSDTKVIYVTGDHEYTNSSVTFKSGSIVITKDRKTGTITTIKTFAEDTTYSLTSTYRCLVWDGTDIVRKSNSNTTDTDYILLYYNNVTIVDGALYNDYSNYMYLASNKRAAYTYGNVTYNGMSVTFGAGSILVIKNYSAGVAKTISFAEDTTYTVTSGSPSLVLRGESFVNTTFTNMLESDFLLLSYNSTEAEFVAGALMSDYIRRKFESEIADIKSGLEITIKSPLYRYLRIDGSGNVVSAEAVNNRLLLYDVSDLIGLEIKLHGYRIAGNNYNWWTILDSAGNVVSSSGSSSSSAVRDLTMTVPVNSKTLYVFGSASEAERLPYIVIPVNKAVKHESGKVSTRRFKMDFSYISPSTGRVGAYADYTNDANQHTPDYIKVHKTITISGLGGITVPMNVFFYDENMAFINYATYQDSTNGLNTVNVDVFEQASWFRISFQLSNTSYAANPIYYKDNTIAISSEWDGDDVSKAPYREYTPFLYSVRVNVPYKIADNPSVVTKTLFGYDQGLIHLPSSYTPNGAPTPVIFFIHGDAERYSTGESSFSGHMKMQQCWSDAGFAQVDLDLIPSCYVPQVGANSGGTQDDYECLSAAWEWLTTHFNVDKRGFYLIGRSRGGRCLFQTLGRNGAMRLPIIAAVSMAGANDLFENRIASNKNSTESMWQLWCDSRGLPTEGRPSWEDSPVYSEGRSFLRDTDIYDFVVANWDAWHRKSLAGWGLITYNPEGITPKDYFDNWNYPLSQGVDYTGNTPEAQAMRAFLWNLADKIEMKSPIPLRLDWCVGDRTQVVNPFDENIINYSTLTYKVLNKTPLSNTWIRIWDGVDETNPYGETDPHFAENMIFYDGDLTLPNGAVTHNPSKVTMEWLIWCMGHDPRYQTTNYSLPWDS